MKRRSELVRTKQEVKIEKELTNVFDVVLEAERAYSALRGFRDTYRRCRNYYFGKQWNDKIKDPETGKTITE
jgi:hypothetical protein